MRPTSQPRCIIIAGPNGAGKTTFARSYLGQGTDVENFINADLIAAGLSPLAPARAMRPAGRLVLRELKRLTEARESFALESTLSGRTYIDHVKQWKSIGYHIAMVFLQLDAPELSVNRIATRVVQGGHHVPTEDALRRFDRCSNNFETNYRPLADVWSVFNSSNLDPMLVAHSAKQTNASKTSFDAIQLGMDNAAKEARRMAKMHGTLIWIMVDGKVVGLKP